MRPILHMDVTRDEELLQFAQGTRAESRRLGPAVEVDQRATRLLEVHHLRRQLAFVAIVDDRMFVEHQHQFGDRRPGRRSGRGRDLDSRPGEFRLRRDRPLPAREPLGDEVVVLSFDFLRRLYAARRPVAEVVIDAFETHSAQPARREPAQFGHLPVLRHRVRILGKVVQYHFSPSGFRTDSRESGSRIFGSDKDLRSVFPTGVEPVTFSFGDNRPSVASDAAKRVTPSDPNGCTTGCTSETETAHADPVATIAAALLDLSPDDRARLASMLVGRQPDDAEGNA